MNICRDPRSAWLAQEKWIVDSEDPSVLIKASTGWATGEDVESGLTVEQGCLESFIKNSTPFTWYIIGWVGCFIYAASGLPFRLRYPLGLYVAYLALRLYRFIVKESTCPDERHWAQKLDSGFIRWAAGLIYPRRRLEELALEEEHDGGEEWVVDAWRGIM